MSKITMSRFLADYVADHQEHPSKNPTAYEDANRAWQEAGGDGDLNLSVFLKAYRTWHRGPDGKMRVGPGGASSQSDPLHFQILQHDRPIDPNEPPLEEGEYHLPPRTVEELKSYLREALDLKGLIDGISVVTDTFEDTAVSVFFDNGAVFRIDVSQKKNATSTGKVTETVLRVTDEKRR